MRRYQRKRTFAKLWRSIVNWFSWEAGRRSSLDRSNIPGFGPADASFDEREIERFEIVRKARYYERNSWLAIALGDVWELYTVGAFGMPVVPSSSDEAWNARRAESWKTFCKYPDLDSPQDFTSMQKMIARRWFFDGEVFVFETRSDQPPFRPRIQIIECHRVKTPPDMFDAPNIRDGIETDAKGRPLAYWVLETDALGTEKYSRKDAAYMIHIRRPTRPGQYRSASFLAAVIDDLQDLKELGLLAMKKAKDAGEISNVINNETGELDSTEMTRKARFSITTQTNTGTEITKEKIAQIRQVLGPRTIALRTNEKITQLRAESPNEIEQSHWEIITGRICAAPGIPRSLVFPPSRGQGTVVRAELDRASAMFRSRSATIAAALLEIYIYVTYDEIRTNPDLANAPKDWRKASIVAPRACNVDVGYNSAAVLADLEAGATTYEDIYGPRGQDWKDRISQRGREEAFIDAVAKQNSILPGRLRASISQALKDAMDAESQNRDQQDQQDQQDSEEDTTK